MTIAKMYLKKVKKVRKVKKKWSMRRWRLRCLKISIALPPKK